MREGLHRETQEHRPFRGSGWQEMSVTGNLRGTQEHSQEWLCHKGGEAEACEESLFHRVEIGVVGGHDPSTARPSALKSRARESWVASVGMTVVGGLGFLVGGNGVGYTGAAMRTADDSLWRRD
jgi:hypothetical protein